MKIFYVFTRINSTNYAFSKRIYTSLTRKRGLIDIYFYIPQPSKDIKMIKSKLLLPVLALSLWSAQPVFADHVDGHATVHHKLEKMNKQLHLTDDQQSKIKAIYAHCHESMKTNHEKLMVIHKEIHALVISPKIDESKLDDLISQKTAIINSRMKEKVMARNQVYNLLTPAQQQTMQKMMQEKMNKWNHKKD